MNESIVEEASLLRAQLVETRRELERRVEQMQEIHRAGIALSTEQDLARLQDLILLISRRLTRADAGTLYVVQKTDSNERALIYSASQTASVNAP